MVPVRSARPGQPESRQYVLGITRMTVHNGPGIRTLILLKGCPLRCLWCSTPESQKTTPEIALYPDRCIRCGDCVDVCLSKVITLTQDTITIDRAVCDSCGACAAICYAEAIRLLGNEMTASELLEEVKKDSIAFRQSGGGVTVSGGEPLIHPDFAVELFRVLNEGGISVGVDTCGYVPVENIEAVLPYIDFFLWDLKHMDQEKHAEYTGVSNRLILNNLRFVSEKGIPVYIRVPIIPGYNDSEENLRAVCTFAEGLRSVAEIHLLPLHHLGHARYAALGRKYPIDGIPLMGGKALEKMKCLVESFGLKCRTVC